MKLKKHAPKDPAKFVPADPKTLVKLKWHPASSAAVPPSKPDGDEFAVHFSNQSGKPVHVYRMDSNGTPKSFGVLEAYWSKPQKTRPGAVWMIKDGDGKEVLGHFEVGDREAQAVIPPR